MNFLILSAGRRVELLNSLKDILKKQDVHNNVYAVDILNTAPAIYFADGFDIISPIKSENYINELIKICKKRKIDLIIPTIDTELNILSENREMIESETNSKILICELEFINICSDKNRTAKFFETKGVKTPRIIRKNDVEEKNYKFPLFIKPANGSSSINAFKVNNENELEFFIQHVEEYVLQEFQAGEEFTIDVFFDLKNKIRSIVSRKRLSVRAGEVAKCIIDMNKEIIDDVKKICKDEKIIGPITLQCIKNKTGIYFIEINPRFGGGAPIGFNSGSKVPEMLVDIMYGKEISYESQIENGKYAFRYDQTILIEKDKIENV